MNKMYSLTSSYTFYIGRWEMLGRNILMFTVFILFCHSLLQGQDVEEEEKDSSYKAYRDAYREVFRDGKIDENEARMLKVFENALGLSSAKVLEIQSLVLEQVVEDEGKNDSHEVYRDAYREALSDGKIDENEARMLKVLENALGLSSAKVLEIDSLVRVTLPVRINKDGEWLLFVQNIGWGLGLYGWGLPYLLGFEERGILAGELMAPFLAYKLTSRLTRDREMNHARAQLIRWGSTIGFRYAVFLNKMRDFESDDDEFDELTVTMLMLGVPIGSLAGDWVWRRSKPSTGFAFVMTFWAETGATILNTVHSVIDTEPVFDFSFDSFDFTDHEKARDRYEREKKSWDRKHNLFSAVGYPLGIWLGHKQFKDRQYSFGDAVLIQSMGVYGWAYGAIFTELIDMDFEDKSAKIIRTAGTVTFPIIADRYMRGKNYSFGQAVLISSGGIAGGLFTAGVLVVLNVQSDKAYLTALLGGATFGLHYANSRLNVSRESVLTTNSVNQKIFTLQPAIVGTSVGTHIPALSMNILF